MLIALFCHNEGKTMGGHTTMFRNIVFNHFGHTEYKHLLLAGDHDKIEKMEEYNKTNIEIGDYVYIRQTKKNAKYITEGTVFKLTNTYVYYEKNGEKLGIRYCNKEIKFLFLPGNILYFITFITGYYSGFFNTIFERVAGLKSLVKLITNEYIDVSSIDYLKKTKSFFINQNN